MSQGKPKALLASEVIPAPDAGDREAQRRTAEHQERVGQLAQAHGGKVSLRVGRGCVCSFRKAEQALFMAEALLAQAPQGRRAGRIRVALHRARTGEAPTPIAEAGVDQVRALLGHAGPGEIVLSDAARQALSDLPHPVQTSAFRIELDDDDDDDAPPLQAHRLLFDPTSLAARRRRTRWSGWRLGAAVAFAAAALITTIVVALLWS